MVVCRTSDFRRKSECFLSWTCCNAGPDRIEFSGSFLPRVLLSPSDNENPYSTKLRREIRKASYLPHQCAKLGENAVSKLPTFARQDVKQYPDRSNAVPSANLQFPISNSLNETIQAPPLLRPCHYSTIMLSGNYDDREGRNEKKFIKSRHNL